MYTHTYIYIIIFIYTCIVPHMPLNIHSHMLAGMHANMHIRASMFASVSSQTGLIKHEDKKIGRDVCGKCAMAFRIFEC